MNLLSSRPARTALGVVTALVAGAAIAPVLGATAAQAAETTPTLCGTPVEATLYAGQTTDAGTVTIGNDEDNLYVTFDTDSPWVMDQTHLAVADTLAGVPQTKQGNPKIGNFAHQTTHNPAATEYTYTISKAAASLDGNQSVVVAAHAALSKLGADGTVVGSETGWAEGTTFVDRGSWATYAEYIWQDCKVDAPVETATETAFAKDTTDNLSTCFLDLDLDLDGRKDFNRWGWTNGALTEGDYTFELYAGAGKCDTSKGTDVGEVEVSYRGETATVTITTEGTNPTTGQPYTMADAQVYVGTDKVATNNGEFTVAPGQYTQVRSEANNTTTQTFTFDNLEGPVYVVAHTSVAGFPLPPTK